MIELHPDQRYIDEIASRLGIGYSLRMHDKATSTCIEKASLLGWPLERIVKAVYLHTGDYSGLIGIITPETGKIDTKKVLMNAFKMDAKAARRYASNGYTPTGMSLGTCTPFPRDTVMMDEISFLVVIDHPPIATATVDISMGDEFAEPHKISMHIKYNEMIRILKTRFPEKTIVYAD